MKETEPLAQPWMENMGGEDGSVSGHIFVSFAVVGLPIIVRYNIEIQDQAKNDFGTCVIDDISKPQEGENGSQL